MIIHSLQAENLRKYRSLRLDELPERGIIAVSGDNETGKSAIGEIICFALFGRTYSLTAGDLGKLVRWGAIRSRVALRFRAKDRALEIIRKLDRGGEQSARLVLRERPQEPVARGLDAVNEYMEQTLGYDFEEYIDTFYLAQREITTSHPHSPSVKAMAGIAPLERCMEELRSEVECDEAMDCRLNREIADLEGELTRLGPDRLRLDDTEQELARATDREQQFAARIGALNAAANGYRNARGGLGFHAFRLGLASLLQALTFLFLVIAAAGLWAFLLFKPELWPLPAVREHLEGQVAAGMALEPTLAYLVAALVGVLLLTWMWTFTLHLGMRKRRARARRLGEALQSVEELESLLTPTEPESGAEAPRTDDAPLQQATLDSEHRTRLIGRVLDLEATPEEVRVAVRHRIAWMEREHEALTGQRTLLMRTLASAREDKDREQQLQDKRAALTRQIDDCRMRIETRRLACELLQGAARQIADGFNKQLRHLASRNLPRFTDGRYEYLQVDDDLQVRVYSNEKRSFLDFEEISSGTQRQIMLALRLALAQEQMSRIAKDRQFVFLDEPFAFFDDTRMRGALRLLPQLSDFITQHWIVAQKFPRDEFYALEIPCGGHPDTLEIGIAEAPEKQP